MSLGYNDTPMIPGQDWHVHDGNRPQPVIVTPGASGPGDPPSDAVILFDGMDVSAWQNKGGGAVEWKIEDGFLEVVPKTGDITTRGQFGSCQLHVEWASPVEVKGDSQGRGNSGIFLMDLYEIQVLDGYDNPTYADGITASIYGQNPPLVNSCRKPGEWQTYDVIFNTPTIESGQVASPPHITILHNGVLVHNHREILGKTGHKLPPEHVEPHPISGPIKLQDHGDLVRYRNIWLRPIG